ncbi:bacterial alpha-L-rhamnosidase-domain-containing protein [Paramyrothecium foliicola]|nr:bacterial alpha-L-rhamnosidase-domain-containing protein [Paramyrothecium foliicola]
MKHSRVQPLLSGKLAASIIKGLQSEGIAATLKHYAVNEQETERTRVNAIVSERALREIYLRPFEIAVKESNPWAMMTAYNSVNPHHCDSNNFVLQKVLRGDWGWGGLVMSDWGATNSTVEALNAGLDLEMPGPSRYRVPSAVQEAIASGQLTEEVINDLDQPAHRNLIREAAARGAVLLKNENAILPLSREILQTKKIALIGFAKTALVHGGGSAAVKSHYQVSPSDAFRHTAGDAIRISYAKGAHTQRFLPPMRHDEAVGSVHGLDGNPGWTCLTYDHKTHALSSTTRGEQSAVIAAFNQANFNKIVEFVCDFVPIETGNHCFATSALGPVQFFVNDKLVHEQTGCASDGMGFLFGVQAETKYRHYLEDGTSYRLRIRASPAFDLPGLDFMSGRPCFRHGMALASEYDRDLLSEAVELAKEADYAIVFSGHETSWESEGKDQLSFELPKDGSFVDGKPIVEYKEGVFVGYRHYNRLPQDRINFSFGHGLSYTSFGFEDFTVRVESKDLLASSVRVKNTGEVLGGTLVQIYAGFSEHDENHPILGLVGFAKIRLAPGQSTTVSVSIAMRDLGYFDEMGGKWISNPASPRGFKVVDVRFEHFASGHQLGTQETRPRLSWKFQNAPNGFVQHRYAIEVFDTSCIASVEPIARALIDSPDNVLVPWPMERPLESRQRVFARVKAWSSDGVQSEWSEPASVETGLLLRHEWQAQRITSPWDYPCDLPQPEELFRNVFQTDSSRTIERARLYVTAQGVYEAEINGRVVGDHFLAPGWTVYDKRLQYQTFDITEHLSNTRQSNVIGIRVAEGWFCGRLSFGGGYRNHWGDRPALMAQCEVSYTDGTSDQLLTDSSWSVAKGPALLAELYHGEKYDANEDVPGWSSIPSLSEPIRKKWQAVKVINPLPDSIQLIAQESEPVRRISVVKPVDRIITSSGKTLLDFGQNLVGYTRIKRVKGHKGHQITLSHAEVLDQGELGRRPLRVADNVDVYTLNGNPEGEHWEPRFTFHGFRYVQVDGWSEESCPLLESVEAVICHTDMNRVGSFDCSEPLLNKLFDNIVWSMRGNFLSIPTDCPQRDERLGWTGDLAVFAPTAELIYNCTGMIRSWLKDVAAEQSKQNGIPPMVVPNTLTKDPIFGHILPAAIWCDVTILAPWALYQASGDEQILRDQYQSMIDWLSKIPRNKGYNTHLWDNRSLQLGDWLDPSAPPENPAAAKTNAILVADAYLIHSLDLMTQVAKIIGKHEDAQRFGQDLEAAKQEFASEYLTPNGRLMSDSQTSHALCLVYDLIPMEAQKRRASEQLSYIVRRDTFKIGTGFAGTPHICEALALAGHYQVAYSMLLNKECPSWLYPVSMGSTTIWERWDSMLPDGSINPGEMTSFNHYALGAVAKFMWERLAGLQCAAPGWRKIRVAPLIGGGLTHASAILETPYGEASASWKIEGGTEQSISIQVRVPPNTTAEIVFPAGCSGEVNQTIGSGDYAFTRQFTQQNEWPVQPISLF